MKISIFKRLITVYFIMGRTFGKWIFPVIGFFFIYILRCILSIFLLLDKILFPSLFKIRISNPIIIVGNPRSGTTFLQRFLVENNFGKGTQLWQMIYSSIILQKIIKPFLPTGFIP